MKKIFLIVMLMASAAFAGGDLEGNGGDAVYCPATDKYTILDIVEASRNKLSVSLGDPSLSPEDKVKLAAKRLEKHIPNLAAWIYYRLDNFFDEASIEKDITLIDIPDSNHVSLPKGCDLVQVAVFEDLGIPHRNVYTIDKNIWDKLDNDNKAVLILHEIIYRLSGQKNSIRSRYLNGLVFSDFFNSNLTVSELQDIIFPAEFEWYFSVHAINNEIPFDIFPDGQCSMLKGEGFKCSANRLSRSRFQIGEDSGNSVINATMDMALYVDADPIFYKNKDESVAIYTTDTRLKFDFYPNKSLKRIYSASKGLYNKNNNRMCVTQNGIKKCDVGVVNFNENGSIKSICTFKNDWSTVPCL
jgi:hypothetical protein